MELAVQPEPPIRAAAGGLAGAARAANREIYPSSRVIVGSLGDLEVERQHRGRDAAPGHAPIEPFSFTARDGLTIHTIHG